MGSDPDLLRVYHATRNFELLEIGLRKSALHIEDLDTDDVVFRVEVKDDAGLYFIGLDDLGIAQLYVERINIRVVSKPYPLPLRHFKESLLHGSLMFMTSPRFAPGMAASTRGINRSRATISLLAACMTITAIGALAKFCWYSRLRSTVSRTSNRCAATRSSSPFFAPDHPASATVVTSCPGNCARNARGTHSSRSTRIGDQVLFRLLERG